MNLTDRDLAFLAWFVLAAIAMLLWRPGRQSIRSILGVLGGKLLVLALIYSGYFALVVAAFQAAGLWNLALLKDTLAWYVLAGLVLLFKFPETYRDRYFYRRALGRLIGVSVAVEFIVGLTFMSLGVELLLLPAVVVLGVLAAFAGTRPEYARLKSFLDATLGLVGLAVVMVAIVQVVNVWSTLDPEELGLRLLLPVWATFFTLPFVALFGLYANYEPKIREINRIARDHRRARWRAKLALIGCFWLRNYELGKYAPFDARELAETTSWGEARRLVVFQRARIRAAIAKQDLAAATLGRYAGVEGTDWRGVPLDRREHPETRDALKLLATLEVSQYEQHGRYGADLPVGTLLGRKLPTEHGIVVKVNKKGTAWFAWRRTVGGWCLGIGANGAPPNQWTYQGHEPPDGFPKKSAGWARGEFDDEVAD